MTKDKTRQDKTRQDKTRQDNHSELDNRVKQIGNFSFSTRRENPNRDRVYNISGIAPCLNCAGGGGLTPYIVLETE